MNDSRLMVDHVHLATDKSFEEVTKAFELQLGKFDADVRQQAIAGSGDTEEARARIAAIAGPSDFMLFGTNDHGALLRLAGQKRKAVQYIVGNPLIALQMTQHDIRASLYAPLRVLLYENEEGRPAWSTTGHRDSDNSATARLLPHLPCSIASWKRSWQTRLNNSAASRRIKQFRCWTANSRDG